MCVSVPSATHQSTGDRSTFLFSGNIIITSVERHRPAKSCQAHKCSHVPGPKCVVMSVPSMLATSMWVGSAGWVLRLTEDPRPCVGGKQGEGYAGRNTKSEGNGLSACTFQ